MADIEQLLKDGKTIQFAPIGFSMFPLFDPRKGDLAVVEPLGDSEVKRGDVVVYRRKGKDYREAILLIHRIWKHKKDGYYLVGDNQVEIEGPLERSQLLGRFVARERNGKMWSVDSFSYIVATRIWLFLRPFRHVITKPLVYLKSKIQNTDDKK